jgi:hypothetical protein
VRVGNLEGDKFQEELVLSEAKGELEADTDGLEESP